MARISFIGHDQLLFLFVGEEKRIISQGVAMKPREDDPSYRTWKLEQHEYVMAS